MVDPNNNAEGCEPFGYNYGYDLAIIVLSEEVELNPFFIQLSFISQDPLPETTP